MLLNICKFIFFSNRRLIFLPYFQLSFPKGAVEEKVIVFEYFTQNNGLRRWAKEPIGFSKFFDKRVRNTLIKTFIGREWVYFTMEIYLCSLSTFNYLYCSFICKVNKYLVTTTWQEPCYVNEQSRQYSCPNRHYNWEIRFIPGRKASHIPCIPNMDCIISLSLPLQSVWRFSTLKPKPVFQLLMFETLVFNAYISIVKEIRIGSLRVWRRNLERNNIRKNTWEV